MMMMVMMMECWRWRRRTGRRRSAVVMILKYKVIGQQNALCGSRFGFALLDDDFASHLLLH